MDILSELIKIKTSTKKDDLIKMLDEMTVYEKLSVNEEFRDLKASKVTREKCPMLAAFVDGELYETTLADLVANIYLHMEGYVPDILQQTMQRNPKQQKQFEVLQAGIAQISYEDITRYEHETMSEQVAAVFTKKNGKNIIVAIIIRTQRGYKMYHGVYGSEAVKTGDVIKASPVIAKGEKGMFLMHTYSMLGNNGYPFGVYNVESVSYDVMMSPDGNKLLLMAGRSVIVDHTILYMEKNMLSISKKKPEEFAKAVLLIIESVV